VISTPLSELAQLLAVGIVLYGTLLLLACVAVDALLWPRGPR